MGRQADRQRERGMVDRERERGMVDRERERGMVDRERERDGGQSHLKVCLLPHI